MTETSLILLASNSPRRRQLIALVGWPFSVSVPEVDESQHPEESAADYVLRLAETKAYTAAKRAHTQQIIIAADTAVVDENEILGKPASSIEAEAMLKRLRAHSHQVFTGVAALRMSDQHLITELVITTVPMRAYSDEEINEYIQTGDPLDKAGAYAIQHPQFQPVEKPEGCFASVMGLPMCHLARMMHQLNVEQGNDISAGCQTMLNYQCAISSSILHGE